MRIKRKRSVPTDTPLVGFKGTRVYPLGVGGSTGGARMLHCHAGNGRSFADYVYRRTANGAKTRGGIGRGTP